MHSNANNNVMVIGMGFGFIVKTKGASWLFVYKYWYTHKSYRHILLFIYTLFEVKPAQITFSLFHFSRHRVPFIQDERKCCMRTTNVV